MGNNKTTMKIDDAVYKDLQLIKIKCKTCKFSSDTIAMLIKFFKDKTNGQT